MKRISMLLLALSMLASAASAAETANELFQQALVKERTEGNLPEAIKLYQRIVDRYASNRKVAAQALLQLADCQSKLGDAQSRKSLERLVRDFADQKETAAEASRRLVALGGSRPAGQQVMRAVWTGPKVAGYGMSSVSPDGRFVSFPDWDTGNLGLHDLVTGADRLLTNSGTYKRGETAYAEGSAISRDGRQVAYSWYDDKTLRYELRVLNLNGDPNPRRVFADGKVDYLEPRDWSPDGKWIATNLWGADNRVSQIALVGVQDGAIRVLKTGSDGTSFGTFSTDGRYLVYTRRVRGGLRAFIISADGTSEVPLLSEPGSAESPVWTADGSRIVFVSDRSASKALWSIRVMDGKPVGEPERLRTDFSSLPMGFSRDGSLYYDVTISATDIYIADLNSAGKLTSEPRRVNQQVGNSWGSLAWLPAGKSLSFWNKAPAPAALVEHTLSTGEEREIWGGRSGRPAGGYVGWFPDGSIMSTATEGQNLTLRHMDAGNREVKATWSVPDVPRRFPGSFAFSPDLMTIYFSQKDETVPCEGVKCTFVMFARDLPTGRAREIFRMNATLPWLDLSVSHDGRDLAFNIGGAVLMVASTADGAPREIFRVTDNLSLRSTAWTQDGSHVLAFRGPAARGSIWSFPTDGGSPEISPLRMRPSEMPAISPDGTQVAFVGGSTTAEIWVMTGLLPSAKTAEAR